MGRYAHEGFCFPSDDCTRIQAEVDWILAHDQFRASKRNRRFLEFIVSETLAGRGERLKAYTIAVDVFGRGVDFDPSVDPIVRIEATRLRSALTEFYAGPGALAELRVTMPKGRYIPAFIGAASGDGLCLPELQARDMTMSEPILALVEVLSAVSADATFLVSELMIENLRRNNVRVIYAPSEHRVAARRAFERFLSDPGATAYAVDIVASGSSLSLRVSNLASSEILCCERIDFDRGQDMLAEAQQVTQRVAQFVSVNDTIRKYSPSKQDA